ncbi:MAG: hypothetical protein AB7V42_14430 [Thermoleophilia bacterium]
MSARGAAARSRPRGQAQTAPARPRLRPAEPARRSRAARRPARAPRRAQIRWGRLLIPIIAIVLAGIVWVNVAKIALTNETSRVVERSRLLDAETSRLKAEVEDANATLAARAERQLGMRSPGDGGRIILDAP